MLRFTIDRLMLVIGLVAVGAAALTSASYRWAIAITSLLVLGWLLAAALLVGGSGSTRRAGSGFLLGSLLYWLASLGPLQPWFPTLPTRAALAWMEGQMYKSDLHLDGDVDGTPLLDLWLAPAFGPVGGFWATTFVVIGHHLIALACGLVVGTLAASLSPPSSVADQAREPAGQARGRAAEDGTVDRV